MIFAALCPGTPEGSTGSGSGFKASQKTGQWLKVSSDRLGEAGNRTGTSIARSEHSEEQVFVKANTCIYPAITLKNTQE